MEKFGNKKPDDNNENETDTSIYTTKKGEEILPYITPPSTIEECGNKKHDDYNKNETDAIMDTKKTEKKYSQI